ncbi:peptidase U61 LD-carboxypeptidase A [Vulcanisaeta moutnovskia 768-28]|uniref:Peptidase U61 LD-carboxypeptidase A n=1 Tax=Vulcanisaeta moutnovskia (strain 768-28) TaxID=985053 RepID=F0QSN8_VULM7|nr:peptidase U61 LD-carboxypeptidase A [Vulcanisaeta moutnovskia 768-28]
MINYVKYSIKPRRLRPGSTIMLVAPASFPQYPSMNLMLGIQLLKKIGFNVVLGKSVRESWVRWHLSGPDDIRTKDLLEGFKRSDVDAIWCVRGGAGSLRLLNMIDYDLVRENPKVIVGFSDITAIQNAIYSMTGLPSLQGPMPSVTPKPGDEIGWARFKRDLELAVKILTGETLELKPTEDGPYPKVINHGRARGSIIGGNLTLFTLLQGTPYRPDPGNKVLFLEDINEEAYRVDNYLTVLRLNKALSTVNAIVYGEFPEPEDKGPHPSLEEVIIEDTRGVTGAPSFIGYPCCHGGDEHGYNVYSVPIGIDVEVDADDGIMTMIEPLTE